ncbi:MAG: hypothetical protein MUC50_08020 [Myxococcota bacterium]|jgi:hypothetical protein|nr:hypothetical protein [Myxococcota bacterium]
MRLELLVTLLLVASLGLVFYSMVLRRRSSPSRRRFGLSMPPTEMSDNEAPITESPTYHRTKSPIAALRKSLDEAKESVEQIHNALASPDSAAAELSLAIPTLRQGLVGAYNYASAALAAVDEQPDYETLPVEPIPGPFAPLAADAPLEVRDRLITNLREMGAAIEVCGPGIASFYLALTDKDERFRVVAAAEQMDRVLRALERAIQTLGVLERELRA